MHKGHIRPILHKSTYVQKQLENKFYLHYLLKKSPKHTLLRRNLICMCNISTADPQNSA
jgi:hypothetical protein